MSDWDGACLRPGYAPIRAPGARGRHRKRGPAFSPRCLLFRVEKNVNTIVILILIRNTRRHLLPRPENFTEQGTEAGYRYEFGKGHQRQRKRRQRSFDQRRRTVSGSPRAKNLGGE